MSFPKYSQYNEVQHGWLGALPSHWRCTQLKRLIEPQRPITYGIVQAGPHVEGGIPYIRPADMSDECGVLSENSVLRTSLEIAKTYSRSNIRTGDIVCSIGPSFGKAMIVPEWLDGANLTQGTARIAVHTPNCSRFIFWVLRSTPSVSQWESSVGGATFGALNLGPLAETAIPVPDVSEQILIAAFLDRETVKIDSLVAEQLRLMDLLKEKRQAVITHAITKGLNPGARRENSGIDWLGEVPAHWRILKGSLIGALFGSEPVPEEYVVDCGELPFIKVGSLSPNSFAIESWDWFVTTGIANQYKPRCGFIVFPKRGAAIYANKVNIADRPCLIDPNLMGWEIANHSSPAYIAYVLKTRRLSELADVSTVPQINNKHIAPERFPVPPIEEQRGIVEFLDKKVAEFDALTTQAQLAIDLLQERRSALIADAVTGQIDVRQLADKRVEG